MTPSLTSSLYIFHFVHLQTFYLFPEKCSQTNPFLYQSCTLLTHKFAYQESHWRKEAVFSLKKIQILHFLKEFTKKDPAVCWSTVNSSETTFVYISYKYMVYQSGINCYLIQVLGLLTVNILKFRCHTNGTRLNKLETSIRAFTSWLSVKI